MLINMYHIACIDGFISGGLHTSEMAKSERAKFFSAVSSRPHKAGQRPWSPEPCACVSIGTGIRGLTRQRAGRGAGGAGVLHRRQRALDAQRHAARHLPAQRQAALALLRPGHPLAPPLLLLGAAAVDGGIYGGAVWRVAVRGAARLTRVGAGADR